MADKKTDTMYRTSPRENGKYYAIEYSSDGGKSWHSTGDSSPTQEEANKKIENMKNGLTASGLTQEEASGMSRLETRADNYKKDEKYKREVDNLLRSTPANGGAMDIPTTAPAKDTPSEEEVNRAIEDLKNGKSSSLTPKQAESLSKLLGDTSAISKEDQKKIREDVENHLNDSDVKGVTSAGDNADQNKIENSNAHTQEQDEAKMNTRKNIVQKLNNVTPLTQYEIDHPNFTEKDKDYPKYGGSASTDVPTTEVTNGAATNDNTPKESSYWTNFLYGNDIGSVKNDKDAKAEKEQKMDNFIKNNPTLIRSIFGKNSGLNFGERVARLGEMLAMIGADATKGAYAGFNHQALPEAAKGRYSEIYNNALNNQYARKQDIFESENKANIDKANRISILKSSPILSNLDYGMLSRLADKMITGITDEEWENYENELQKSYNPLEIEEIKSTFNTLRNTFSDITTQRGNIVELNGKEFDLMRKPQQAIAELQAQKAKLNEQLVQVRTLKYEQLKSFLQSFKSTYAGIQSVSNSMSENKEFGYNASTSVSGGIPVVKGSVSGGVNGGTGSAKSTGTNTDQLALEGLQTGEIAAEEWNKDTATYRKLLEDSIKEAIKEIDSQIAALKKFHSIDDGIVKAPHMKQWLVREDGTRIALNPSDSIYATKNKLTTKKDNKSENVVPMEKEDKVVVIQKKLGHNCDKRIIKNNDYYLSKLK